MKKEIKERWVAALRSGDYPQGTGFLQAIDKYGSRFCCLGVLCDLAEQDGVIKQAEPLANVNGNEVHVTYNDSSPTAINGKTASLLPRPVQEWSGLDSTYPLLSGGGRFYALIDLNDEGTPFEEIADIIEELA